MMTKKQREVFDFCLQYLKEYQRLPTQKAIKDHFGYKSINSGTLHIKNFVKTGAFERVTDEYGNKITRIKNLKINYDN